MFKLTRKPNSKRAKLGEWTGDDSIKDGSIETTMFTNMFGRLLQ